MINTILDNLRSQPYRYDPHLPDDSLSRPSERSVIRHMPLTGFYPRRYTNLCTDTCILHRSVTLNSRVVRDEHPPASASRHGSIVGPRGSIRTNRSLYPPTSQSYHQNPESQLATWFSWAHSSSRSRRVIIHLRVNVFSGSRSHAH